MVDTVPDSFEGVVSPTFGNNSLQVPPGALVPGKPLNLTFVVGNTEKALSGNYRDVITVTIQNPS